MDKFEYYDPKNGETFKKSVNLHTRSDSEQYEDIYGQAPEQIYDEFEKNFGLLNKRDQAALDGEEVEQYNKNNNYESFNKRTDYYFKNTSRIDRKIQDYQALSQGGEAIDKHVNKYSNRGAYKRKKNAKGAAKSYSKMRDKIEQYKDDDTNARIGSMTKYKHKKEIILLRLDAMNSSAVTKSKSKAHEKFLKGKAKYSCYMILKDQLAHLIADEKDEDIKDQLNEEMDKIDRSIRTAKETIENNYVEPAQPKFSNKLTVPEKSIAGQTYEEFKWENSLFKPEDAEYHTKLKLINDNNNAEKWPYRSSRYPVAQGQTKPKEFKETEEWNKKLRGLKDDKEKEKEALDYFNNIQLPLPEELSGEGLFKYVNDKMVEYYDLTNKALPYYKEKMESDESFKKYCNDNPKFVERVKYLEALNEYIEFRLRKEHHIKKEEVVDDDNVKKINYTVEKKKHFSPVEEADLTKKLQDSCSANLRLENFIYSNMAFTKEDVEKFGLNKQTKKDDEKKFNELKKLNNAFTKEGFGIIKNYEKVHTAKYIYNKFFDSQLAKKAGFSAESFDRGMSCMLKYVEFNEKGEPASEKDMENHKWNLRWIGAVNLGMTEEREKMIQEYLPHIYDNIDISKVPRLSEKADLENEKVLGEYVDKINMFCEDFVHSNQNEMWFIMKQSTALDSLRHAHKSAESILKGNKKNKAMSDILDAIQQANMNYIMQKYNIDEQNKSGRGQNYVILDNPEIYKTRRKNKQYSTVQEDIKKQVEGSNMSSAFNLRMMLDEYDKLQTVNEK